MLDNLEPDVADLLQQCLAHVQRKEHHKIRDSKKLKMVKDS